MFAPAQPTLQLTAASTIDHFEQILDLQKRNQRDSLTAEEQAQQGFVYAQYNVDILQQLASKEPQIIALDGDIVAGYTLSVAPALISQMPDLQAIFYAFDQTEYEGRLLNTCKYIVGGQVCVDKAYRGQGLLKRLYNEMRTLTQDRYEFCVTDVSQRNTISLNAHLKVGFQIANTYPHDGETWHTVVWDWR